MTLRAGRQQDPIVFDLEPMDLSIRPKYEAISYVWGAKSGSERVFLLSGGYLLATRNLLSALRRLRHARESRVLWADALCINQNDLDERSVQVAQMATIYSRASKVLVWLGEEEENEGHRLLKLMDNLHEILSSYIPLYHIRLPLATTPEDYKKYNALYDDVQSLNMDPLIQLLKRPWFRRAWVVQEVVKGREAVLIWGRTSIPWDRTRTVFSYACAHREDVFMHTTWFRTMDVLCREVGNIRSGESKWDLVKLIHFMSDFDCTDPRDRIYSILGLVRTSIRPDYRLSLSDLCKSVVRWMVEDQATLDILSLAGLSNQSESGGIPSWAPQQGCHYPDMMFFTISYNATRSPHGLSARRQHLEGSKVSINGNSLFLRGHVVDSVADLTSALDSTYHATGKLDRKLLAEMMTQSLDVAAKALLPFKVHRFKSFLITLCGESPNFAGEIGKLDDEMAALEGPFVLSVGSSSRGQWLVDHFPLADRSLRCAQDYLSNRCFGLTASSRFSILPSKSRKGDMIALIQGSVVPHVIRPTEDGSFLLIGECVLHGAMQGDLVKREDFQWDSITLV